MSEFTIHNQQTAPEGAKSLLENSIKSFGMIPNLHGILAESPQFLEAYQRTHTLFMDTSFSNEELTVVWQTINNEHNCHYCLPAHTFIALSMKVDPKINDDVINERELADAKLETLRKTTLAMVRQRGVLQKEQVEAFYEAGYEQKQLLEIILGLAQKVMSNYVNHVADTPIDEPFKKYV